MIKMKKFGVVFKLAISGGQKIPRLASTASKDVHKIKTKKLVISN
jgi:hypothetical protein